MLILCERKERNYRDEIKWLHLRNQNGLIMVEVFIVRFVVYR